MKNIKKIVYVITALCLLFSAGCSEKKDSSNSIVYYNDSNEYSQEAEGIENSDGEYIPQENIVENIPTTPGKINEPGEIFGSSIKLTDVYGTGVLKADEAIPVDRQLLAFVYEITNNTDEDIKENAFCLNIHYLDGEPTDITTGVREMINAKNYLPDIESFNSEIKPGETKKGFTAIAVDPEWESMTLYYNPVNTKANDSITFDVTKDMVQELEQPEE